MRVLANGKEKFGRRVVHATLFVLAPIVLLSFGTPTFAQYKRTDLVSNQGGTAVRDPNLVNAWGITRFPFTPFWVSDNGTGVSTLYDGTGQPQPPPTPLVVTIPSEAGGAGTPTGIVANGTGAFSVSEGGNSGSAFFIFANLDGTISGWNPGVDPTNAVIAVHPSAGTVDGVAPSYTGLAIGSNKDGNFLFAADNSSNRKIDVFGGDFKLVHLSATAFSDPHIPREFTPYAIHNINGQLWVTYTALNKAQGGFVDVFDTEGNLVKHFAANGPLHSPWGVVLAPPDFGPFSNAILISNNARDGRINAFDPETGKFLGTLRDAKGQVIVIDQVWGLSFGADGGPNGAHNQLFFTAGPSNYANGLFGMITLGK